MHLHRHEINLKIKEKYKVKKSIFLIPLLIPLLIFGFNKTNFKPLWNDEINTQTKTLNQSYSNILLRNHVFDDSLAPLFYIQQKILCDLFRYQTPQEWLKGDWSYRDRYSNVFLRILPVFWMSLSFLLLFIYFSNRFNLFIGFLSLFIAFSTHILLAYWAEARPYGLWVFFTVVQLLLFIELIEAPVVGAKKWVWLSIIHIALSLTCILSFFQITIVSMILFLFKERRWNRYIFLLAVPLIFIYFYKPFLHSVTFFCQVRDIFYSILPKERINIFQLYPLLLGLYFLQSKKLISPLFLNSTLLKIAPFFIALFLMVFAVFIFLSYLWGHATGGVQVVTPRHVIFLAPLEVIAETYLIGILWESFKHLFWMRLLILAIITFFYFPPFNIFSFGFLAFAS